MAAVETNNPNTSEDIEIEATSLSEDVEVKTSEEELKEESTNAAIPTLHNIYHNGQEVPEEKTEVKSRSKISRSLYSKLHKKNFESHTVSKLKGKFEQTQINNDEKSSSKEETKQSTLTQEAVEDLRQKYSPASFGYPKPPLKPSKKVQFSPETKTKIPIPAPRKNIATVKKPESVIEVASVELKVLQPEKPAVTYIKPVENGKVKDENANVIPEENVEFAEPEEKHFVLRASSSDDSIAQVESILNEFIMDGKPKEKKRSSSFRKILSGSFFGKDKKKGKKNESIAENVQNESSSFVRGAPHRHTTGGYPSKRKPSFEKDTLNGNYHNEPSPVHKELEEKYAQMHINKFNEIKNNFTQPKPWNNPHPEDYVCMDIKKDLVRNLEEPTYGSYMNSSNVSKYIDTSSSSSTTGSLKQYNTYENALIAQAEMQQRQKQKLRSNSFRSNLPTPSREPLNLPRPVRNHRNFSESPERFSATPPRAQETYQNLQLVKPKALIPISSERALPNPFQNGKTPSVNDCRSENERTLDRNLNTGESKDYPNKSDVYCPNRTFLNDTYGTVFDSIENKPTQNSSPKSDEFLRNRSLSPANRRSNTSSPRSPSLEGSKLRLPPNREKIELQPRIKSPIPQAKVSTDKIIATELLKPRSSPITVKKQQHSPSHQNLDIIEYPESIDSRSQDTKLSPVGRKTFSPTQELVDGTRNSPVTSKPPVSPKKQANVNEYEAAEWYRKQKEIDQFPTIPVRNTPPLVTTDAMVHKDPHLQTTERPSRPVMFTSSPIANNNNIYGQVYPTERSVTPVNTKRLSSSSLQLSPEKQEMRQNVEAFYWKELKKLKEKEEMEYYYQLQRYGYADDALLSRRSRASTTSLQRTGRRSLSLPRDVRPVRPPSDAQRQPEPIPEDQVVLRHPNRPELIYGYRQPFVRNSQERSTIGPIGMAKQMNYSQRPIFNRGSLNNQDFVDNQSPGYKKAVSFGGHPQGQIWPTRNGYVQNPPQRMVRKESLDDEVFLPNPSRPQAELRGSQPLMSMEAIYNQRVISNGRLSEDLYVQRLNTQCNPIYGQFISNRPPKQITVSNKVCDIYGQIHDEGPKVGILPGQLTYNPQANFGSRQSIPSNFVRGSRLTASANDMYRRYQPRDPRYRSDTVFEPVYETRRTPRNLGPLPPVPTESRQRDMSVEGRKEFVGGK